MAPGDATLFNRAPGDADGAVPRLLPARSRRGGRIAIAGVSVLVLALAALWGQRGPIADHFIGGELRRLGLPGRYRIESIGPGREVLRDLVIGDPAHPDLTVARVEVTTRWWGGGRLSDWAGGPVRIDRVTLERPG